MPTQPVVVDSSDIHNAPSSGGATPTYAYDASDPTPVVSPSQINSADVPEFERPVAQNVALAPGNMQGAVAHSTGTSTSQIDVDRPDMYTSGVQAHELAHMVQKTAGVNNPVDTTAIHNASTPEAKSDAYQAAYDYGGTNGLANLQKQGKTVADLNNEQQASIPENYMKEYVKAEKSGDTKAIDRLNHVYEPAIKQLRNMANTSKDTINTDPDAPGPPPAALTGLVKALPGMLSRSTKSVDLGDVHNAPAKSTNGAVYDVGPQKGKAVEGMLKQGNIDVNHRPSITNDDGSHSSIFSMTIPVNKDGSVFKGNFDKAPAYALVPSIANGKFLTPNGKIPPRGDKKANQSLEDSATDYYDKTREHLGIFKSADAADKYATATHAYTNDGTDRKVYTPSYNGESNVNKKGTNGR